METMQKGEQGITWTAPESHFFKKTSAWYIGSAIIAALLVIFAFWQENLLFVFFIVVAEILALFWGGKEPRMLTYALDDVGFVAGNQLFRFESLTGYALVESLGGPNFYELVFTQKQTLSTYVKAFVPNEQAQAVNDLLSARLSTFEYFPSLSEALMNRLGL